jgi:hypothetical protein
MHRADGLDGDSADADAVACAHFDDVLPSEHPAEADGNDESWPASQVSERWDVKVIVMAMRDDDRVGLEIEIAMPRPHMPVEWAKTVDEKRIGEDSYAVELDEDRRMTEEAKAAAHR